MALNNLYSSNGGIYVRPLGLPDYYPVPGFPHGCKSLLPPSTSLAMQSFNSHKPSTRTMAPISPLQVAHQPSAVMSPYNNPMLNSHQTSSFAAALRKLAKQAGEPPSTENGLLSTNSVVNQTAVMPQMYLNSQQGTFSNNSSSSVTSTSLPYHNGGSKKGIDSSAFSLATTNNNQLPDSLRGKYGSFNHPLYSGKWEERYIGTKELTSSAHIMTSMSVPSSSSTTTTENASSGRGFQPYRLMEERQHISSQFSLYDTPYAYPTNFISSPQVSSHTYRLEDAFYLERYGLLRTPMMHFPSAPNLIPHPHTAFYHTGTYPSELITPHMGLSSPNVLLEQERLKREQRLWAETKDYSKPKEQELDKMKISRVENNSSPISFSKELSDKRRDLNTNDSLQNQECKSSMSSGSHTALLNLTVRPKLESEQNTSHFGYSDISNFKKVENNYPEQLENKVTDLSGDSINLSQYKKVKNAKQVLNNNTNSSNFAVFDKNGFSTPYQKNYHDTLNFDKEYNSQDKLQADEQIHDLSKDVNSNSLEKKAQPLELTNFAKRMETPLTNCVQNTDNYQLHEQPSRIISKLDLEEWKMKNKNYDYSDEDSDIEEGKKYNFLHIILKGPPLPLDFSPKKLKFLKQFNLIMEQKKREIELEKFISRRERLRETVTSPSVEVETEAEQPKNKTSYCNYFVPILVDKTTFMKVINLYPVADVAIAHGVQKSEKMPSDEVVVQNGLKSYPFDADRYPNVYSESTLGVVPLVHSAHLYKDYFRRSGKDTSCSALASRNHSINGSVKQSPLSRCSKRHCYSKLWIPKHKKQKLKTNETLSVKSLDYPSDACRKEGGEKDKMGISHDTKETPHTSVVGYQWPGIEMVMESYRHYVTERNLEREILMEKCRSLKIENRWLSAKLEKKRSCMLKLIEKKKWLEKRNKIHKVALDNLKRYLRELR
ncbi:uncharacterized protein LOC111612546 isoform X1 [Centruroides sculpturatus]|uniref:uncharacterized protein LOC111612546 isoform X1 n=2 Tax=Centruroides sculpturatus TaxID=218467 RepID=UPI000C6DCBBF|nr:uncharacterized protein LOC111612546 isoform X1 [Centruroides sculpturatus]